MSTEYGGQYPCGEQIIKKDGGDILENAKAVIGKCHLVRETELLLPELIAEIDWLRSLNESLMENGNDLRTRCQKAEARIKELEAEKERIESAFLKAESQRLWDLGKSTGETSYDCKEARETLERIKAETGSGDHVAGANKLILTAEQRGSLDFTLEYLCDDPNDAADPDIPNAIKAIRSLLSGSVPAWEATDERIAAMEDACNFLVYAEIRNKGVNPGNVNRAKNAEDVLRAMLEEGKRNA